MVLAVIRERETLDAEAVNDCLRKVKRYIERQCQAVGHNITRDIRRLYTLKEGIIMIYMLGNEEIAELRLILL